MDRPIRSLLLASLAPTAALAALLLSPGQAPALAVCSAPVKPICATGIAAAGPDDTTAPGVARSRCVEDAETYRERLVAYRQCLEGTLAEARSGVDAADTFIECLQSDAPECHLDGPR